jgi:hypothetical protein
MKSEDKIFYFCYNSLYKWKTTSWQPKFLGLCEIFLNTGKYEWVLKLIKVIIYLMEKIKTMRKWH